jgi:HEAT repeat protein
MMFEAELREEISKAIPPIVECLKDSYQDVRSATTEALSLLGAYCMCPSVSLLLLSLMMFEVEFHEEIGKAIPCIIVYLKDSAVDVRSAAVSVLSSLGAYRMCPSVSLLLVS